MSKQTLAWGDAPERIYDRRRCTRDAHRTCCRGSSGSASPPAPLRGERFETCDVWRGLALPGQAGAFAYDPTSARPNRRAVKWAYSARKKLIPI